MLVRAQRTHTQEFNEITPADAMVAALTEALLQRKWPYNQVRLHQAHDYPTAAPSPGSAA